MNILFDLPLLSAVLFVLVGILAGNLIWDRDRSAIKEKIDGLENRYFKARGSARQRKREVVQLKRETETQHNDVTRLGDELTAIQQQKLELESAALEAGDEIKRLGKARDEAVERFDQEHARSESLVGQLQEVLKAKSEVEDLADSRQAKLAQVQTSHQELEAEIERLRASMDTHAQTIATDRDLIEQLQSQNQTQTDELGQLRGTNQSLESEVTRLQVMVDTQTDLVSQNSANHETMVSSLRKDYEDGVARMNHEHETSVAQMTSQHESTISAMQQEIDELRMSLKDTQADLVARCEDLDHVRGQHDSLTTELESAASSLGQQRQLLESREEEVDQFKVEMTSFQEKYQAATKQLEVLTAQHAELNRVLGERDEQVAGYQTEVSKLQQEIAQLEQLRSELSDVAEVLTQQKVVNEERSTQIESLTETIDQLRTQIAEHEQTIETGQKEMDQREQTIQRLNEKIIQHEQQIMSQGGIIATRDQTMAEQAKIVSEQARKIEQQAGEINEHTQAIDEHERAIEALNSTVADKDKELGLKEGKIADMDAMLSKFQNIVREKDAAMAVQKEQLGELATVSNEVQSLRQKLAQATEQLDSVSAQRDEFQTVAVGLDETISGLKSQIKDVQGRLQQQQTRTQEASDALAKQAGEYQSTVDKLESEVKTHQANVEDLRSQLTKKSQQYDKSLSEISGLTRTLKEQRETILKMTDDTKEVERLRAENKSLTAKSSDLMAHLKRVSGEHEDSLEANAKTLDRIRELETDLHQQAAKIRELRRERASIRGLDGGEEETRRAA